MFHNFLWRNCKVRCLSVFLDIRIIIIFQRRKCIKGSEYSVVYTLTQKIIHHYVPLFKKKKYVCFLLFQNRTQFYHQFSFGGENKYDRITLSEYKTAIVVDVFVWKCINYTYVTLGHCLSTLTLMFIVIYAMYYLNRVTMMMIYYYFDMYNKLLILLREINSWDKVILLRYSLLVLSPPPPGN